MTSRASSARAGAANAASASSARVECFERCMGGSDASIADRGAARILGQESLAEQGAGGGQAVGGWERRHGALPPRSEPLYSRSAVRGGVGTAARFAIAPHLEERMPDPVICPDCGRPNPPGAESCESCNFPLRPAPIEPTAAAGGAPRDATHAGTVAGETQPPEGSPAI